MPKYASTHLAEVITESTQMLPDSNSVYFRNEGTIPVKIGFGQTGLTLATGDDFTLDEENPEVVIQTNLQIIFEEVVGTANLLVIRKFINPYNS